MHKGVRIGVVFGIWVDGINYIHLTTAGHQGFAVTNYHLMITAVKLLQHSSAVSLGLSEALTASEQGFFSIAAVVDIGNPGPGKARFAG